MSKHWEPCPRCEGTRVMTLGKFATFLVLIGTGSCLIWVGFLFPPIWIFSGLLILGSPLGFLVPKMNQCRDCNYTWRAGQAKEYIKATEDIKKITEEKDPEETFMFKVVGVTRKNEEGKNIQSVLKSIIKTYKESGYLESFDGMTNNKILKEYEEQFGSDHIGEFESQYVYNRLELVPEPNNPYDENAIKVYIYDDSESEEKHHIGYVGREDNIRLNELIDNMKMKRNHFEFIGGKYKSVEYDDLEDKHYIETKTLTLGVSVFVSFGKE